MSSELLQNLQALLTPTIAIIGTIIAILQYRNNVQKRNNDLFDRRYKFYCDFKEWWMLTGDNPAGLSTNPPVSIEDLIPLAEEARYLFGEDISKHILSLEDCNHSGSPFFPNSDFIRPFSKYLKLK